MGSSFRSAFHPPANARRSPIVPDGPYSFHLFEGRINLKEAHRSAPQEGDADAEQATQREEREAVRGTEAQGHVEAARRAHRQLARRLKARREEIPPRGQLDAGGDVGAEE